MILMCLCAFYFYLDRKIACVAMYIVCLKLIQCRYSSEFEVVLTHTNTRAVRKTKNIKNGKNTGIHDPLFAEPNIDCIGAW